MEGIKNLPLMVKQGSYMVKLDIKKAYLHVLVDPHYRDLLRFVWNGVHYRWKTMPFGLSTAPRIFTMLLRPVLRMLRELNVSVIAYLDDLLIVGSTKEECLSNLNKTMELLLKLVTCSKRKEEECNQRNKKLLKAGQLYSSKTGSFKRKADSSQRCSHPIPIIHSKNKFYCQCLSLSNGDWDQSLVIPQDVKSEISNWLTLLTQWNGKEKSLFSSYDYVPTTDASESGAGATLKKGNKISSHGHSSGVRPDARSVNGLSSTMSESQQLQTEDSNRQHNNPIVHQSSRWSNPRSISPLRTALEAVSQEKIESQVIQDNQELQLETQEGGFQSHSTSVRSNSDGSVCISPQPSNDQLLHNQNECTSTRLESMEVVSSISTSNTFAFCPGEDQLIEFDEGFYNTDIPGMEISNMVSDDSKSSSSSSSSSVSSSSGYIPRSIVQRVGDINKVVISTLSKSGIDVTKFKSHSTRSAMTSLLLSNNVPFHVVKKMGRWKSNDTVDTFYDKKIIGEKSGGFLNTVVQLS
ncbi:hypothetical protein ACTFIV_007906 [Dictyostelium citrinum]